MTEQKAPKYWMSGLEPADDFGIPITDTFYDGKTALGPWAIMTPRSWRQYCGKVGTGYGQKYEKQADGRWLKTEG